MKTTKNIGDHGEGLVCDYLKQQGFEIIDRNWRTRYCEIDIIAKKNNRIHFVEVKTRKSELYGSGFEYITPKKLKQMRFAAEFWVHKNDWQGECLLSAASVTSKEVLFIDLL